MGEVEMEIKSVVLSGILLASSAMVACGGGYRANYVAYSVPPPPAPYAVGAVGYAPGAGYVWVDGFWNLNGSLGLPSTSTRSLGTGSLGTAWQ